MKIEQLQQLLAHDENPKLEFKREWYSTSDKLDDKGWGEFLKDVIALANGNIGHAGKPAYLIIGVSDQPLPQSNLREISHVTAIGMLSQLQTLRDITLRKLRETCSPSLPDINFEFISFEQGKDLLVITIPSPAGILKLDRDLNTRGMRFRKGTIFIRVGQDINVADPTEILALQREYGNAENLSKSIPPNILHNLPQPDYVNFVGRKEEIQKLRKLLHPSDRVWTIVIDGIGGIGKTALALEVGYQYLQEFAQLPQEEQFSAIIWVSAKASILTVEGIKSRQQVINTINDIYKTIAVVLGEDDILHKRLEEQDRFIHRALTRRRTLLIIDNLETIDDERVNSFIRELPNPTKCIVTTRHRIDIADPIRLLAMPREDAFSLIKQECDKKNVSLSNEQTDLLYKRTGGVPLAMVWSVAQMNYHGYDVKNVLHRLGDAKGDIARFCFERAIQIIKDKPAYLILVCLSISSYNATRKYLGEISDLSELDRDEGLVELEKLSLVNKQADEFAILPLVKQYIIGRIKDLSFEIIEKMIIRIAFYYAPAGAEPVMLIEPFFGSKTLADLKERVAKIIIDQLWEWEAQYDEIGVCYCIGALEDLATESAIYNIKCMTMGSMPYASQDAIFTLSRLGGTEYLANIIKNTILHSPATAMDAINSLEMFGDSKAIPIIDKILLSAENNEDLIKALTKAKEEILLRKK